MSLVDGSKERVVNLGIKVLNGQIFCFFMSKLVNFCQQIIMSIHVSLLAWEPSFAWKLIFTWFFQVPQSKFETNRSRSS